MPAREPTFLGRSAAAILAALLLVGAVPAAAQTLYAVSVRTYSDPGYKGVEGNLYTVAPDSGATTLVAALSLGGQAPLGLDGLAIDPKSGTFYGITAPSSNVIPHSLVTVDPRNGFVTLVGDLGMTGSDIVFDREGTLYAWLPETRQVGTVDLSTGLVTPRGRPMARGTQRGGFTLTSSNRGLIATSGGKGTLDSIDLSTGAITTGPALVDAPFPELMSGMALSPEGLIFAINTDFGTPASADLVTIEASSGKVRKVGPLPNDTDAICFGPSLAQATSLGNRISQWRVPVLLALAAIAAFLIFLVSRTRQE
jgi:hypothetical protein